MGPIGFKIFGRELALKGYTPIPIKPGRKTPGAPCWQKADKPSLQFGHTIRTTSSTRIQAGDEHDSGQIYQTLYRRYLNDDQYDNHGTGILLGGEYNLVAIDIDTEDQSLISQFSEYLFENHRFFSGIRKQSPHSNKFTVIVRSDSPFPSRSEPGVFDFLSKGRQTVLDGIHPAGGSYSVINEIPDIKSLPVFPSSILRIIFNEFTRISGARGAGGNQGNIRSVRESEHHPKPAMDGDSWKGVADALMEQLGDGKRVDVSGIVLNELGDMDKANGRKKEYRWSGRDIARVFSRVPVHFWDDYDFWLMAGQALHDINSGDGMFDIWCGLSRQSRKYDEGHQSRSWKCFRHKEGRQAITMGSICYIAGGKYSTAVDYKDAEEFFAGCVEHCEGERIAVAEMYGAYRRAGGVLPRKAFTAFFTRNGIVKKKARVNGKAVPCFIDTRFNWRGMPGRSAAVNLGNELDKEFEYETDNNKEHRDCDRGERGGDAVHRWTDNAGVAGCDAAILARPEMVYDGAGLRQCRDGDPPDVERGQRESDGY